MDLETINRSIHRLICKRRETKNQKEIDRINVQLDKLYDFKYELLGGNYGRKQ